MKIVIVATGTRGDVQPVIALALGLKAAGHDIRIIAGKNFTTWVESFGLEMHPTLDIEAMMQSEQGIKWVESRNQLAQLRHMKALLNSAAAQMNDDMLAGTADADLIISGFTSEPFVQTISEKRGTPTITLALQPYRATRSGAASLLTFFPQRDIFTNRIGGRISERFMWSVAEKGVNDLRDHLRLTPHSTRSFLKIFHDIPAIYAFSPHVVPPVDDNNSHTTGYLFLEEKDYTPPENLAAFLSTGEAPVYIGFGSMSAGNPQQTREMVIQALAENKLRAVLAKGWSGMQGDNLPENIFMLESVPHTWLFPRMRAVVHHGGAGTTAAGLRAGVPTLIIPHMADQPYWGRRVYHLGVGVKPLERGKMNTGNLSKRLHQLTTDETMKKTAAALGEKIRAENGVQNAVDTIQQVINV